MLVYAGIDEAGYGPLLGPLCIGCTAFVVPDHDPSEGACDLWKRLAKAVCRKRTDRRRRLAIDDSKLLKAPLDGPHHPLKFLERGVLAFRMAMADCPACDDDLFSCLDVSVDPTAWYASRTELPVGQTPDELRIASARLRRALEAEGVDCEIMRCEAIDAGSFNRQVASMGNKASVNFCAVLRMIDAIWKRWPEAHPRIIVDRLGGRTHYLNDLMHAFPDAGVQVLAETETLCRYRLSGRGGSQMTISFLVDAEVAHLPVALASMIAKYVRELFMIRLNRHFNGLMPELKPTAGYIEDGRRYLADIEGVMTRLGVDRAALVRCV